MLALRFKRSLTHHLDGLGQPVGTLVVDPLALLLYTVFGCVPNANSVLKIILPLSDVFVAVRKNHCALSIFLALLEVAVVLAAVLVGQPALALEQILREAALVGALRLREVVDACTQSVSNKIKNGRLTLALEHAVDEVALVEAAVGPLVATAAVLLALVVLALKLDLAELPCLLAVSMLVVVHPFTFVSGALGVDECSATICHAVAPLALVNASVGLNHSTEPLHLIHRELALILRAVWPDQDAQAILDFSALDKTPTAK